MNNQLSCNSFVQVSCEDKTNFAICGKTVLQFVCTGKLRDLFQDVRRSRRKLQFVCTGKLRVYRKVCRKLSTCCNSFVQVSCEVTDLHKLLPTNLLQFVCTGKLREACLWFLCTPAWLQFVCTGKLRVPSTDHHFYGIGCNSFVQVSCEAIVSPRSNFQRLQFVCTGKLRAQRALHSEPQP